MIMGMLSYKYTHRVWAWITGAGVALLYPASAYAQNMDIFAVETFIGTIIVKILTVLNLLTWILFGFLTYLLDPRFMFDLTGDGKEGSLMDMLNQIWQLSRDITNIGFAIMLVVAAVIMIVKADKGVIQDKITGFVLTVILVNFSWFIPRVILDVANVATATIFGIPSLLNQAGAQQCKYTSSFQEQGCTPKGDGTFTCDCILITNMQMFVDDWKDLDDQPAWECPGGAIFCYKYETMQPDSVASYSAILNGLIVNHGRLRELGRVPAPLKGGSKISELVVFIIREIILVVFHIAFFFPLLAMAVAFFVRIPILWVTMAFMPFFFLGKILPDSVKELIGDKMDDIMKQFLKAAFLPAVVAVPLSIGFIMINAGAQLTGNQSAGISIRLFDGVSNLWQLMWMCMSMGVLWVGVFKALAGSGNGIIEKSSTVIKGAGENFGRAMLDKVPVPVPGLSMNLGELKAKVNAGLAGAGAGSGSSPVPKATSASDVGKAAKSYSGKPADIDKLSKSISKLADQVRQNKGADAKKTAKGINDMHGDIIGSEKPVEDLEKFVKELKNVRTNEGKPTDSPEIKELEKQIENLRRSGDASKQLAFSATPWVTPPTGPGTTPAMPPSVALPPTAPGAPQGPMTA